jgi:hypothetical protein
MLIGDNMKINKRCYLYGIPIFIAISLILSFTDSEVINVMSTYYKDIQPAMFNYSLISIIRIVFIVLAFASYIMYFLSRDKR